MSCLAEQEELDAILLEEEYLDERKQLLLQHVV
jgi:hypothetical protein